MTERIQKIIATRGITSRRKAEEMITAGRVTCNGRVCLLGESADPDIDKILLDGKPLPSGGEHMYIMPQSRTNWDTSGLPFSSDSVVT